MARFLPAALLALVLMFIATIPLRAASTEAAAVAVLAPDLPAGNRDDASNALAWRLDELLLQAFAADARFIAVDRQHLHHLLDERQLQLIQQGGALVPLAAAGVLVTTLVEVDKGVILIEAVAAQSGQRLASLHVHFKPDQIDAALADLQSRLPALAERIQRSIARQQGRQLLEITSRLDSSLPRMAWQLDALAGRLVAHVALHDRLDLLVPYHPLRTRDERLLRVLGLSEARAGDKLAGLAPTPQLRLVITLTDNAPTGKAFDQSPISLSLTLHTGTTLLAQMTQRGIAADWHVLGRQADEWLARQLATHAYSKPTGDVEHHARALAQEELDAIRPWLNWDMRVVRTMSRAVRIRIAQHAMRAAHLDPTDEMAWFMTAHFVEALHPLNPRDGHPTLESIDQSLAQAQQYVDRFAGVNDERHRETLDYLRQLAMMGAARMAGIETISNWPLAVNRQDPLAHPPQVKLYPYMKMYARANAELACLNITRPIAYRWRGRHTSAGRDLLTLIASTPDHLLDEEHEHWRRFYADKVPLILKELGPGDFYNGRPLPWELIDAAFEARKGNLQVVQDRLKQLAAQYPRHINQIWGGPPYLARQMLKLAGDLQWHRWEPDFPSSARPVVDADPNISHEVYAWIRELTPQPVATWDASNLLPLQGRVIFIPENVPDSRDSRQDIANAAKVLLEAGGDLWLTSTAGPVFNSSRKSSLFVMPDRGEQAVAIEVPWPTSDLLDGPPQITSHLVDHAPDGDIVWIGTRRHGLARFEKNEEGSWAGRWFHAKHGAPTSSVSSIGRCFNGDEPELLIIDTENAHNFPFTHRLPSGEVRQTYIYGTLMMVWSFNPVSQRVTLIHDGFKDEHNSFKLSPTAELKDGRLFPLALARLHEQPAPLQVRDIRRVITSGPIVYPRSDPPPATIDPDGNWRVWDLYFKMHGGRVGRGVHCDFQDYDVTTLKMIRGSSPGRSLLRIVSPDVLSDTRFVMNLPYAPTHLPGTCFTTIPVKYQPVDTLGRGPIIWMALSGDDGRSQSTQLVGYRPAPRGSDNWEANDQWYGPFVVTDQGQHIISLRLAGTDPEHFYLSTSHGIILKLDSRQLIKQAQDHGAVSSTKAWLAQYRQRVAQGDWTSQVANLISEGQFRQAKARLDEQEALLKNAIQASGKPGHEAMKVRMWQARLMLEQPHQLSQAVDMLDSVAGHPEATAAMEMFARANQLALLRLLGRWQDLLDLIEKMDGKFPYMTSAPSGRPSTSRYTLEACHFLSRPARTSHDRTSPDKQ